MRAGRQRPPRRTLGAALAATVLLGAVPAAAPAWAEGAAVGEGCVLHVSGAKPRPFRSSAFVKVKGPLPDPDDPGTSAYQYNPFTRARALTDAELRSLFPAGTAVEIVRHDRGLTKDGLVAAQGVLFPRRSGCHAELIVSDVVGVFPTGSHPYGLIGTLLAGGNRVELIFTFRRFEPGKAVPRKISDRESGRLPRPEATAPLAALGEALTAATSEAFAKFARRVVRDGKSR
ncbi:MAG TPA: hypothetical protein VEA60_15500 [Allosphingosinicella sp.]|nr:hypothetical protein [Allosphingosinicella sp.]